MKVATWNIYWLGEDSKVAREESDIDDIAKVIALLDPDILAVQEVVDADLLADALARSGTGLTFSDSAGRWWSSAKQDDRLMQKTVVCLRPSSIECLRSHIIPSNSGRRSLALELRSVPSGHLLTLIAVHLRSGYPLFYDSADAEVRRKEVGEVCAWIAAGREDLNDDSFPADTAIIGDLNAELSNDPNESLSQLKKYVELGWRVEQPRADQAHAATALFNGDRYVLDHVILSSGLAERAGDITVWAWDCDERLGGAARFHHHGDPSADLVHYRVSDHRPVSVTLAI